MRALQAKGSVPWCVHIGSVATLWICATTAAADDVLDEVIVTANRPTTVGKLDVPLKDQPQNVSVISRQTLDDFGSPRIEDIAYATVGLQPVALQQGATSYGFFLRGFNGAPIITDGYYSSNNAFGSVGIIDMATVQSVEVLRGPAALLYGQGNPGGVINLTSKAPLPSFGVSADVTADEHGKRRFEGDITGRLIDELNGRLVAVIEDGDTFRDFIHHKRTLLSPQFALQIGERVRVRAQYTYDDFRYVPDNGPGVNEDLIFNLPIERSVQEPDLGHVREVNEQARLEADVAVSDDWTVRIGAFGHRKRSPDGNAEIDPDVTLFDTTIARVFITQIEPGNNGAKDGMLTLQVLGRIESGPIEHNVTAAVDAIENRSKYDYAYFEFAPIDYAAPVYTRGPVVPDPDLFLFSGEGAFKSTVEAVYVQDLMSIGEQWKALVGLRRENIKTIGYADAAATIEATTTDESKTTPRFGLVYDVDDSLTLYASYSEAFVPNYGVNAAGNPFEPEESRSYELGARKQIGNGLLFTTSIYDIEKENILVVDPQNDAFNINAGVARSKGFEAELQGRFTQQWRASIGAAYNDAEITRSTDAFFPVGDTLPAAAHWSALLNSRYEFAGALNGLTLGMNASYTSSRPYVLPNTDRDLDAYVNLNVFATYAFNEACELQINVNNLTDERILLANGYGRVQFEPSRTVIASVRYRLGAL